MTATPEIDPAIDAEAAGAEVRRRRKQWSLENLRTSVATGRGRLYLPRHVTLLLTAGLVVVVGLAGGADLRYSLILSTVYAVAILGNNAVHAALGELSLGSGMFIAFGAYVTANGFNNGWSIGLTFGVAVFGSMLVGAIFALPMMRLNGIATALVTFALAFSTTDLTMYLSEFTGGDAGMYLPADIGMGSLIFSGSSTGMLILAAVVMVIAGVVHLALLHFRPGRLAINVGEAEPSAAVFAVPVRLAKLAIWAWAAALAGAAGFLYSLTVGYVTSTQWTINLSIFVLVGGLIGGTRSAAGAWIGGLLVAGVPLWLQGVIPVSANSIAFGVILLAALLVGGKGLSEFGERALVWCYASLRGKR